MTTALYTHPDCLTHITPTGHPEQVARLEVILEALSTPEFDALDRHKAEIVGDEALLRVHPQAHLEAIRSAAPTEGFRSLDPDTHMSPGSLNAALRAAGAQVQAVEAAVRGNVRNAFCAVRPPGHHAETQTPMGFCLFGNVVVGARHALDALGLSRVAIMDFDVHHGNGTQDLVWDDARILFTSTHQSPLYPGTGLAHERGAHDNILNVPLAPLSDGAVFRKAMQRQILPTIDAFAPEMIFISAGFDAHAADPLANLNLVEEDFVWATQAICDLADAHCAGRVVSTLEGGYDLPALAASVAAHVRVLMERGT